MNQNQYYRDPLTAKLSKQVEELSTRMAQGDSTRQEDKDEADKVAALKILADADPNFNKETFLKYLDKTADEMGDKSKLFSLVNRAMQHEAAQNQISSKGAKVETGSAASSVKVPENVDIKDKSIDDLFEDFAEEHNVGYA